jgi:hypothetical protein
MYELKKKAKIKWPQLVADKDTQNECINSEYNLKQIFFGHF